MKFNKRLSVNGETINLISDEINFSLNWIGKARFMIENDKSLLGVVNYQIGIARFNTLHNYFNGLIESCTEVSKGKWQIIAREYLAACDGFAPIALRHVTLKEVLAKLSSITGVKFATTDKSYANTKIPFFYHTGSATEQIQALGKAFSIPDYIWFQQGDGTCWLGAYEDSFWVDKKIDLLAHQNISVDGQSITLPLLPAFKPGATINGKRINQLSSAGSKMVVQW
jgi:hypothetical protein